MDFEILGEIQWAETIASGRSIRELRRLNRVYGKTTWKRRKELLKLDWPMARYGLQNSTGMKGTAREKRKQK